MISSRASQVTIARVESPNPIMAKLTHALEALGAGAEQAKTAEPTAACPLSRSGARRADIPLAAQIQLFG
jgi:hypothetical protein